MGKKKTKSKPAKSAPPVSDSSFKSEMDFIAAAICSANQTVFLKVCRLCESKDGPFLNIFDADKVTAKKIDELMPFKIAENDDLPHKICFRCSAKVEELYEFIQKCIKTQHSLHTALGKKETLNVKSKSRTIWEEKLNKSNISNDDICDALIKKAMEGIKDIPLNPVPLEEQKTASPIPHKKDVKPKTESTLIKKETRSNVDSKEDSDTEKEKDISLKQLKMNIDRKFLPTRTSRSQNPETLLDGLPDYKRNGKRTSKQNADSKQNKQEVAEESKKKKVGKKLSSDDESSSDNEIIQSSKEKEEKPKPVEPPKPFNIMDHVSIIKVNGVGVLFQCKLCNRNFLKKDVVMTHGCAKNGGVPKEDFTKSLLQQPPEPPRAPVVKYINTKTDGELGKSAENKTVTSKPEDEFKKIILGSKPKPKIGPASKVKRNEMNPMIGMTVAPLEDSIPPPKATPQPETPPATSTPSVQFPTIPSLNSRYKLVPGPNNTFQLVEASETSADVPVKPTTPPEDTKSSKKRKSSETVKASDSKAHKYGAESSQRYKKTLPEIIDLEDAEPETEKNVKNSDQPYPVGLFSTLPHHSSIYPPPVAPNPPTFTTPAMKKQSYTIVQTGNPSKLLISTKPQPPIDEPVKKRAKKSKHESKEDSNDKLQQPFNVTLEDAVPPKDSFFTFINVDPLLQPSYVLPTNNIIQESQISTSTPASKANAESKDKDKYACNMCDEKFSREKKLLAHIHSHYNKMDEEDMLREKNKKRGKK